MASNILDRMVGWVSPKAGLAREKARLKMDVTRGLRNEYDGATRSRRSQGWRRTSKDANYELLGAAQILAETARDMVRNNPYAERAVSAIACDVVGAGITFEVMRGGKPDAELTKLAKKHFESTDCDADGRNNLYGLQLLAMRTIVESGSVLARFRPRFARDGLTLPFQIQLLEPDFLDRSRNGLLTDGSYVGGIEFDQIGNRKNYWMFKNHPGAIATQGLLATPIVARDVVHCFRMDRPGQQHGASWFAPVVMSMRDFADYQDAQILRQKIAASWAVFITGDEDASGAGAPKDDNDPIESVEPGMIEHLPYGKDVKFATPPGVEGYADFTKISVRTFATGLNLPYDIFGDLEGVNFSSGRIGRMQYYRQLGAWQWSLLIPQFCEGVGQWFLRVAAQAGHDVSDCHFAWTPPRRELIDPASEYPALRDAIRAGLMTPSAAIRERGDNPDEVFAEWARDAERFDTLGLTFDCDPRKVTQVGNLAVPGIQPVRPVQQPVKA